MKYKGRKDNKYIEYLKDELEKYYKFKIYSIEEAERGMER